MKFLEAVNLHKSYKRMNAVQGVDFYVKEGEILGLLGPNGAGKTTTISMISSLITPTKGDILLKGKSILSNFKSLRKMLGVVPQDIALYPELTGYENLAFFGRVYGLRGKELGKRIDQVLDLIGLQDRAKDRLKNFSGGMKRRMNIGAALLHQPKLLIMDEPTVGIDPQSRNHILNTVKRLSEEGMTILYTTHYMEEAEYLCDRIYIMDFGKIIAHGTKAELIDIVSQNQRVEIKLDIPDPKFIHALEQIPQVIGTISNHQDLQLVVEKDSHLLGKIFQLAEEHHVTIMSINVKTPSLEDVFLQLTGRGLRD